MERLAPAGGEERGGAVHPVGTVGRDLHDLLRHVLGPVHHGHEIPVVHDHLVDQFRAAAAQIVEVLPLDDDVAAGNVHDGAGQGQRLLTGQERLAQEGRALLRSGAVQHGAVFTQKAHLVRHGGEQRAHGVVLPAGGGTEQDIPLPQAADQGKQPQGHDGLVIGQQRAVDIGCNETDHKTLLLGIRMENGEKRPRQGASFPTAPGRGTGADLLHAQRALRDHPAVPTTE